MPGEEGPGGAGAGKDLEDTRGEDARRCCQGGETDGGEGGLLRGLEDHGVSRREGRAELEAEDGDGDVPGEDAGHGAEGLWDRGLAGWWKAGRGGGGGWTKTLSDDLDESVVGWIRLAGVLVSPSRVVLEDVGADLELKLGERHGLSDGEAIEPGELIAVS